MANVPNDPTRSVPVAFFIGDVLRLRKPHPCGGFEWTVVRLGADIGLACTTCGRRVLLPRREVERRTRQFVSRGVGYEAARALLPDDDAISPAVPAPASRCDLPAADVTVEPDGR